MAEAPFESVGKAFVNHYYATFDSNRANLANLYQEQSMFTWEGEKFLGAAAIAQKLTTLPFQQCAHQITSIDCQPTSGEGVLVFVCGNLKVEGEAADRPPLKYSQSFVLMPLPGGGGYWVLNDIFRLNYG
uniref:Nuclear transport factor 2 n=1 Tax=Hemiselmis andersenii TaxID=464988 RepID=A0A6U4I285_HEMAN|mmetsp:Transcript_19168/g.44194  ORF Transcript_19168/g.44194 Transcript_19168/m.44194 type:complete len:130 (-) Transcript_19168:337-726(-)|eukprot:CAMPEP_0114135666 /NCGR_PEP_ID=MMETSP0043_2-20121206/14811_1 /TAXON_ID=464988 /ORGANISM="Hemiselmis andersenii, Strain CCMP644" /LENGTH=129 /DNA_ID=CAMNT_0001229385 /DNA_START=121 /DNA_END=510 /DNA_ORIENTATION=-